ncbi:hypothetical protein [Delftia sp. CH05]|uniref:hypothetical protein n=1 Tax=Delftia sp. CH05 TaxID=2692194 RepID=UPI00135D5E8C|nr:hypothetical protein [Delftia sp. CH05]MXN31030.1 hypothetical protein [Delftia sp. CH05]
MIDIAAAISSTATMLGIAKGAIAARDDAKAQQAITEVQLKLLEVSTAALSLSQANISLTDEIRALKNKAEQLEMKASEREGYVLSEVCPGAYAYQPRPGQHRADDVPHYLCQVCYDKGVKSVLRFQRSTGKQWNSPYDAWNCLENSSHNFVRHPE